LDCEGISDAGKRKQTVFTHLADLTVYVRGEAIEFESLGTEWADQAFHTIAKTKAAAGEGSPPMISHSIPQARGGG